MRCRSDWKSRWTYAAWPGRVVDWQNLHLDRSTYIWTKVSRTEGRPRRCVADHVQMDGWGRFGEPHCCNSPIGRLGCWADRWVREGHRLDYKGEVVILRKSWIENRIVTDSQLSELFTLFLLLLPDSIPVIRQEPWPGFFTKSSLTLDYVRSLIFL